MENTLFVDGGDSKRFAVGSAAGGAVRVEIPGSPAIPVSTYGEVGRPGPTLMNDEYVVPQVPPDSVTSPTFVLVNEYTDGRLPIYHFDTYRLKDDDEFLELGPEEYFDSSGLVFVEWADRVADLLPSERLDITIEVTGPAARRITLTGTTPRTEELADRIRAAGETA